METNDIGWLNTDGWMQEYAALQKQQRARQQSDNMSEHPAGFEQQLAELQLRSSDESSGDPSSSDASSADNHAAQAHGRTQRANVGGSVPSRSNLRDNWFSSTHYSVDLPRAHLGGSAAEASRSDLRDRLFSSTRYTALSEAQPAARTKNSKSWGLWSRVKSAVGKVFGGSRREKSSGGAASYVVVHSELRMDFAKRRRAIEPFESDTVLISRIMRASVGSSTFNTAQRHASHLRNFSAWLNEHQRGSIADRLNQHGLEDDARDYAQDVDPAGSKNIKDQIIEALENLRHADLPPAEITDDERLISEFKEAGKSAGCGRSTVSRWVHNLHNFRTWLRPTTLTLSSLLDRPDELKRLATLYVEEGGKKGVHPALTVLQESHIAKAEGRPANFNLHPQQRLAEPPAEDKAIMERFKAAAMQAGAHLPTIDDNLVHLKKFANWLRENNKEPLAPRFRDEALADDIDEYKAQGNDPEDRLHSSLTNLRRLGSGEENIQQIGPGPRLMGPRLLSPHPEDAGVIDNMFVQALRNLGDSTSEQRQPFHETASRLRGFSDWLRREDRSSIVGRLRGTGQQHALDEDVKNFRRTKASAKVHEKDLTMLRNYLQLVEANKALGVSLPQQTVGPFGQADLQEPAGSNSTWSWMRDLPTPPSESEWPPMVGPFGQAGLQEPAGSSSSWSVQPPSYFDFPTPRGEPAWSSDVYRDLDSFTGLPSTPQEMRDDAQSAPVLSPAGRPPFFIGPSGMPQEPAGSNSTWSWMRDLPTPPSESEWPPMVGPFGQAGLQEPAGSSSSWSVQPPSYFDFPTPRGEPAWSSDVYRDLDSFTGLPSTPQEMRDDAQSAPVISPAGRPAFYVGPSGVLEELEDIGHLVGKNWQHGSRPVSDSLLDVLDNNGVLPTQFSGPRQVSINGETYSITLGPRGDRDAQFVHHPRPSLAPAAQIGTSVTGASSGDRSGRVLGPIQWLGDEHIQRDYELLTQQLQESNPDLAARTRFVDPLIAQMLRSDSNEVAQQALGWLSHHTADFLFLPVNNAGAAIEERGSHWSLLLVDQRDRENPVAYHYDSYLPGPNTGFAVMLARRLRATPQHAPIRQQSNGYDCGVFVLDGTRELVRRLAATRQPDLNLNNLVIDRRALQDRLGADVGFN
ncbi:Ulp1 family isopeptidase [Bradyrhizobium sp. LeoA1S1]